MSMTIGITLVLVAGFFGGRIDNLLMRIGDTVLSIPTLLMAILVSAIFRQLLPPPLREPFAAFILVLAILSEATLSFLGVGMPITRPSLGTLIRIGNQYLFSGSWCFPPCSSDSSCSP